MSSFSDSQSPPAAAPSLEGIAIVGMAGRFPGAETLSAFWENLTAGRETISTIPVEEIPTEENKLDPDYVPRRGVLEKPEWFDAAFFNINPREAEVIDPQQRLFLESCQHALEDAGCDPSRYPGAIGVYAGMSNSSWVQHQILPNAELRAQFGYEGTMIANEKDYLATRTAYKLNLRGPALNIYTACSTSLVAVCQAVQALQSYACDAALAGGVSVKWPQHRGYTAQEGSLYSPDGHCRPYDADSRGTVFSNGLGVVLLKRLEDAVREGDHVWAVIKGAALNNDGGGKASFTAPSVDGHAEVIALAQALANIDPDTISYVEGHGTATPIGDPIEVAGLTQAFRLSTGRKNFCGLGSLKSNTGHMDAAAGIGGLIKTTLALHHRQLPPTLHFKRPNPALNLEDSPFYIVDNRQAWTSAPPLRAGVSSFGVGGTNAHVVLEEAPATAPSETPTRSHQLLVLSAKTPSALTAACDNLATHLESLLSNFKSEIPNSLLADTAWTLQTGRQAFPHRRALAVASIPDAIAQLRTPAPSTHAETPPPPVVFLFPGQGSQHPGMGEELYAHEPAYREAFEACAVCFAKADLDLHNIPDLDDTRFTQPALFAVEYALGKLLLSFGLTPSAMLGHSIGEYVAATLAGVMSLEDATKLVALRGRLMASMAPGSMLAIRLPEAGLLPLLPSTLDIAALNAPGLSVVSGPAEAIDAFALTLEAAGHSARKLRTSHAFHSAMMDPLLEAFRAAVDTITLHPPQLPYISNLTGEFITGAEATDPAYYVRHIRHTVRFADGVATLCQAGPSLLLEVGPGTALAPLAKQHPAAASTASLPLLPPARNSGANEYPTFLQSLGKAWTTGLTLDWPAFHHHTRRRRLPLPGYPFERQRYCPDTILPAGTTREGEAWIQLPTGTTAAPPSVPTPGATAAGIPGVLVSEAPINPAVSRHAHLVEELRTQLHQISGIDTTTADPATPFLDLGFDSLFLTSASNSLKKHFGLKITFRQLMEDQASIADLATWLDAQLPSDKFPPATPAPALQNSPPAAGLSATPATGSTADRLAVIEQQISALRTSLQPGAFSSSPTASAYTVPVKTLKGSDGRKIAFGPFKPIERAKDGSLTPLQQAHLTGLIAAYTAKYPKAKAFTADHRDVLADPRAVAGFNLLWKDMVFPAVTDRSEGAYLWDTDGHRWIDVVHGFGLGFFGHRPKFVTDALHAQIDLGFEIGPTSPLAGEVAHLIRGFSGQERVAFCNTGSEALMAAIRTSRTISGRNIIAMFAGGYHGIFDEVLARPLVTNGELRSIPIAPGIPDIAQASILVLEYDNPESLEILQRYGHDIACVLVEPVMSRRPDVVPIAFVQKLRAITRDTGTALVFDEVVLGFRTGPGGAQAHFGIQADLVAYGKIIGGGMPLGVICGQRKYMDALDGGAWQYGDDSMPEVGVTFFAGTFIRHPLTLAAARAVLLKLKEIGPTLQQAVELKTRDFVDRLNALFESTGVPLKSTRFSSMWMLNADPGLKYSGLLYYHLRLRGIHLWEGRPGFLSVAHTAQDVEEILTAFADSISALQRGGFFPLPEAITAPLIPAQQEMFLASRMSPGASLACHESLTVDFSGPLQPAALEAALQQLARRHESLRTGFDAAGGQMMISPGGALPLVQEDLSSLPEEEASQRGEEASRREFLTPFDLARPPLMRALLLKLGPDRHRLTLTAHHIICDGWSYGVLMHELPLCYRSACGEPLPALAPAPSYAAYAETRTDAASRGEFEEARAWWRGQFATRPQPLELPADLPRRADTPLDADSLEIPLPAALTARLRNFCRANKVTPYVAFLTAWQCLLGRLTGQDDVVIGTPLANQPASGNPGLVGHCVQFLPLRLTLPEGSTATSLLALTRRQFLAAQEHLDCTLGEVLDLLPGLTATGRSGFVRTTFTLEPAPGPLDLGGGLHGEFQLNAKRRLGFDLSLFAFQTNEGFRLLCVYRNQLFHPSTVARWMQHYQVLLEGMIAAPATPVRQLPLLSAAQREEILTTFNDTGCPPPPPRTAAALFEEIAAVRPDQPAILQEDRVWTYGQLNATANRIASILTANGVARGDRIAVYAGKSFELVAGLLGILKAGAAYVPVDPSYPKERVEFLLRDAGIRLVLTDSWHAPAVPGGIQTLLLEDAIQGEDRGNPNPGTGPEDIAYLIYTSGSTGLPKGNPVPHRGIVRLVRNTNYAVLDDQQTFLLAAALSFDASTLELWGPLLNGGRLALLPDGQMSLEAIGDAIRRHGVTTLWLTSGLFSMMVDERLDDLKSLRQLLAGGDVLSPAHVRKAMAALPETRIINGYGPTENTTFTCCHTLTPEDAASGIIPIGKPVAHTTVYVLDAEGQPVPPGVPGELWTGGEGLAPGYWNRPELTAKTFVRNPFSADPGATLYRTGDLVRWRVDGVLEFLGRIDTQVKIRGFRIEPGEVENILGRHLSVEKCCVAAVGETAAGKRLVAWVVVRPELPATPKTLREAVRQQLPEYMVPSVILLVDSLPVTANGKIDYRALPLPDASATPDKAWTPPQTATEIRLASLWQQVLGTNHIGPDTDFFDTGGTSLNGLRLIQKIRQAFSVALPLGALFKSPPLSRLSEAIDHASANPLLRPAGDALACLQRGLDAPPLFLLHGGDGGALFYRALLPGLGPETPVYILESPALTDDDWLLARKNVEATAHHFITLMQTVQAEGPYRIGGYSFGGLVAYEMAQQLRATGQSTEHLILFDTENPGVGVRMLTLTERLAAGWRQGGLDFSGKVKGLGGRIGTGLKGKLNRDAEAAEARTLLDSGTAASGHLRIIQVRLTHIDAIQGYKVRPYPGSMVLLRSTAENDKYERLPDYGWGTAVASLQIRDVQGNHLELFDPENAGVLASQLRQALEGKVPNRPFQLP